MACHGAAGRAPKEQVDRWVANHVCAYHRVHAIKHMHMCVCAEWVWVYRRIACGCQMASGPSDACRWLDIACPAPCALPLPPCLPPPPTHALDAHPHSFGDGELRAGQQLWDGGEHLTSGGDERRYKLSMADDRRLVLSERLTGRELWAGGPSKDAPRPPFYAELQEDGNLVTYGVGRKAIWSPGTFTDNPVLRPVVVRVQCDGRVVMYDKHSIVRWSSEPVEYVTYNGYVRAAMAAQLAGSNGIDGDRTEGLAGRSSQQVWAAGLIRTSNMFIGRGKQLGRACRSCLPAVCIGLHVYVQCCTLDPCPHACQHAT